MANASLKRFEDREIFVEINENIRGEDVFIIQSTSHPANDHLMELLITIDAAASIVINNSIRWSLAGCEVDWIMKTSSPLIFSLISTKISLSSNLFREAFANLTPM